MHCELSIILCSLADFTHNNKMTKRKKVQVVTMTQSPNGEAFALRMQTNVKRGQFWQNITGGVDRGEKFKNAAIREFCEETSLTENDIVDFRDLGLDFRFYDQYQTDVKERVYLVTISYESLDKIKLDPKEHDQYEWTELSKISKQSFKFYSNYLSLLMAKFEVER